VHAPIATQESMHPQLPLPVALIAQTANFQQVQLQPIAQIVVWDIIKRVHDKPLATSALLGNIVMKRGLLIARNAWQAHMQRAQEIQIVLTVPKVSTRVMVAYLLAKIAALVSTVQPLVLHSVLLVPGKRVMVSTPWGVLQSVLSAWKDIIGVLKVEEGTMVA
jgi:hypothetical protein